MKAYNKNYRIINVIASCLTALIIASCSSDGDGGTDVVPVDPDAPVIDITNVADGTPVGINTIIRTGVEHDVNASRVEFYVNGALYFTASSSPYQFNLFTGNSTVFAHGSSITLEAAVFNAQGVRTSSRTVTLLVDNIAPAVEFTSPAEGDYITTGTLAVSVSAYDDSTESVRPAKVDFYSGTSLLATSESPSGSGPYVFGADIDSSLLADGPVRIRAVAYDAAGNTSQAYLNLVSDRTNPFVSIISPAGGSAAAGTVQITASASDSSGIVSVSFYSGTELISEVLSPPYTAAWDTSVYTSGTIRAVALDGAGNSSESTVSVLVDNGMPAAAITSPAPGASLSGAAAVSVTAANAVRTALLVDGTALAEDGTEPFSFNLDSSLLSDGAHSLKAAAWNSAGLRGESGSVSVNVDNSAPSAIVLVSHRENAVVSGTVTLSASVIDNLSLDRVEFYADGSYLADGALVSGKYEYSWDTIGYSGSTAVSVRAYDSAGNFSEREVNLYVDNDSPSPVTIVSPSGAADAGGVVPVLVSAADAAGVDYVMVNVNGSDYRATKNADGSFQYNWDSRAAADASYTVTVTAYDYLGIPSSASVNVTVDNTAPAGVSVSGPSEGQVVSGSITATSNASGASRVEFYVDDTLTSQDTAAPYESASIDTTALADGSHSVTVIAYDDAGNSTPHTVNIVVDNSAPSVTLQNPSAASIIRGTVDISASASASTGIDRVEFIVNDGTSDYPVGTASSYPYTVTWNTALTGGGDGYKTVTAVAYNRAGGSSNSSAAGVLVDNTAPSPPDSDVTTAEIFIDNNARGTVTLVPTAVDPGAVPSGIQKITWTITGGGPPVIIAKRAIASEAFDTTALTDGAYSIALDSKDNAGNSSTGTTGITSIVVDNTAPVFSTGLSINSGDAYTNNPSVTLTNDVTDTNLYQMSLSGDNSQFSPWEAVNSPYVWNLSGTDFGRNLVDGSKTVYMHVRDKAGNAITVSDSIFLDTNDPTTYINEDTDIYINTASVIDGVSNDNVPSSGYSVTWSAVTVSGGGTANLSSTSVDDPTFNNPGGDGVYELTYSATDNAGNNSTPDVFNVHWDTTPPTANAGADKVFGPNTADRTLNGSATDDTVNDATAAIKSYLWSKDSGPGTVTFSDTAAAAPVFDAADFDGTYVLRLTATDLANNTHSDTVTVMWDSAAPTGSFAINEAYVAATAVTLNFSASDTLSGVTEMRFSETDGGGSWVAYSADAAYPFTLTGGDGTKTVYAEFRDAAGNVLKANDAVELDTGSPTAAISAPADLSVQTKTFNLNGTTSSDAETAIDTYLWEVVAGGTGTGTVNFADAASSSTACSADSNGTYIIRLTVTDMAGNSGSAQITIDWQGTVDPEPGDKGKFASIATYNNGTYDFVYACYYNETNGTLKFAQASDADTFATWDIQTVEDGVDGAGMGQYASLKIVEAGANLYLGISYYDADNGQLKFTYASTLISSGVFNAADLTTNITVADTTTSTNVGMYSSLVMMYSGTIVDAFISYHDEINGNLMLAYAHVGGAFAVRTVDTGGTNDVGEYTAITCVAAGGNYYNYIAYHDATAGSLKFTHQYCTTATFGSWNSETPTHTVVDTGTSLGKYTSIRTYKNVSNESLAYISYYDEGNHKLKFAFTPTVNTWGTWDNVDVDSSADVGQYSSLAMIDDTDAFITYYDVDNTALKYARAQKGAGWDMATWTTSTIDNGGGVSGVVGKYSSIDAMSNLEQYVGYYDETGGQIKFCWTNDAGATDWNYP